MGACALLTPSAIAVEKQATLVFAIAQVYEAHAMTDGIGLYHR